MEGLALGRLVEPHIRVGNVGIDIPDMPKHMAPSVLRAGRAEMGANAAEDRGGRLDPQALDWQATDKLKADPVAQTSGAIR